MNILCTYIYLLFIHNNQQPAFSGKIIIFHAPINKKNVIDYSISIIHDSTLWNILGLSNSTIKCIFYFIATQGTVFFSKPIFFHLLYFTYIFFFFFKNGMSLSSFTVQLWNCYSEHFKMMNFDAVQVHF